MLGSPSLSTDTAEPRPRSSEAAQRALLSGAGAALLLIDIGVVCGSFVLAYILRFVVPFDLASALPIDAYAGTGLTVGLVAAGLLALQGLADLERARSWPTRLRAITAAVSTGTVIAIVVQFDADLRLSRTWLALGWSISITALVTWLSIAPALYFAARRHFVTRPLAVIVGANALGAEVARELAQTFEVLGYVDNGTDLDGALDRPFLGPIAELGSLVRARRVNEIIVAIPPERREQLNNVIARGFGREVAVKIVPELGANLPRRVEVGRLGAHAYIGYAPVARVSWLKRAMDLYLGVVALIALAPLLIAIAVAVRLSSPGPVMYRQRRVGLDGKPFEMLKFRSMRQGSDNMVELLRAQNEATGPLFKMRRDPRITPVGRFLRRFSLDELPQLINVLRGEMSLVGPRPPLPTEVARYEEWQLGRLQARPGMTGLWQVSGRSEVPFNDMVRLDLHYVRNWSFGLDLEIVLRTIPAVLSKRGAY
ncbi:MAG TPA: sugar transferase [Candidatus Acidoferrales bacterium]|nr:sugar transferase [Candidatus Acidoferrales bacterium]